MKAQNGAEREKSAEDGQNATPPAGSKAGRLGIAEKVLNFLLGYGVSQLCSSNQMMERAPNRDLGPKLLAVGARG